jgi:hypothetical protein
LGCGNGLYDDRAGGVLIVGAVLGEQTTDLVRAALGLHRHEGVAGLDLALVILCLLLGNSQPD